MAIPELKQRITIEGAQDVVRQLEAIGTAGNDFIGRIKALSDAFESRLGQLGKFLGVIGAVGGGLLVLAKKSSDATGAVANLSDQAGTTTSQMSGMVGALTNFGAKTEALPDVFKHLSVAITSTWSEIQQSVANAASVVVANQQRIVQSTLGVENAQLSLLNAQRRLGELRGITTDPEIAKATEFRAAQLAVAQAEAALTDAVQKRAEAVKKAADDQKNDINIVAAAIKGVLDGVTSFKDAAAGANLTVDNIFKGIVANSGPAAEQLANFKGSLADIGSQAPNVQSVFFKLADLMKATGDNALSTALAVKVLGKGVNQDLVEAMSQGSAAIQTEIDRLKSLGLTLTELDKTSAKGLEKSSNTLKSVLGITTTQIGNLFAPAFTEGIKRLTGALEQNHGSILAWAQDVANRVAPIIRDFFRILTGETKLETPWVESVVNGTKAVLNWFKDSLAPAVVEFFKILSGERPLPAWIKGIGDALSALWSLVVTAMKGIAAAIESVGGVINRTFDTGLNAAGAGIVAFSALFLARLAPITAALAGVILLLGKMQEGGGALEFTVHKLMQVGITTKFLKGDITLDQFGKAWEAESARHAAEVQKTTAETAETIKKQLADAATIAKESYAGLTNEAAGGFDKLKTGAGGAAQAITSFGNTSAQAVTLLNGQLQEIGNTIKVISSKDTILNKEGLLSPGGALVVGTKNSFGEIGKQSQFDAANKVPFDESAIPSNFAARWAAAMDQPLQDIKAKFDTAWHEIEQVWAASPIDVEQWNIDATVGAAFTNLPATIGGAIAGVSDALIAPFQQAATQIDGIVNQIVASAQRAADALRSAGSAGSFGGQTGSPFARGGMVFGPGTSTSDSILARLSSGEFVIRAAAVAHFGPKFFAALNNLRLPKFEMGGLVNSIALGRGLQIPKFSFGGLVDELNHSFELMMPQPMRFADGGLVPAKSGTTLLLKLPGDHGPPIQTNVQNDSDVQRLRRMGVVRQYTSTHSYKPGHYGGKG